VTKGHNSNFNITQLLKGHSDLLSSRLIASSRRSLRICNRRQKWNEIQNCAQDVDCL